jgi:anti-anti-sigma factor
VVSKATISRTSDPNGLRIEGEVDLANAGDLEAALREAIQDGPITVDLTDLTFIDSSGLHAILRVATSMDGQGPIRLQGVSGHVMNVLRIVGLTDLPQLQVDGVRSAGG